MQYRPWLFFGSYSCWGSTAAIRNQSSRIFFHFSQQNWSTILCYLSELFNNQESLQATCSDLFPKKKDREQSDWQPEMELICILLNSTINTIQWDIPVVLVNNQRRRFSNLNCILFCRVFQWEERSIRGKTGRERDWSPTNFISGNLEMMPMQRNQNIINPTTSWQVVGA